MGRQLLNILTVTALTITSCEKPEQPIEAFDRGDIHTVQVYMGSEYENQIWYNLDDQAVVRITDRFAWDIALSGPDSMPYIYLNSALAMQAAGTGISDFDAVTTDQNLVFRCDHPCGKPDSLAMAHWWSSDQVWVIDLGYLANGNSRGKRKIKLSRTETGIAFKVARLNGADVIEGSIDHDENYRRVAYRFSDAAAVDAEPPMSDYDLVFTQYTHVFYNPYNPYLVSGTLINTDRVRAVEIKDIPFEEIDLSVLAAYPLNDSLDVIGYDWKYYDLEEGTYTVHPEKCYLIQDGQGFYYKMHFVDFYDDAGEKGFPTFELKRL